MENRIIIADDRKDYRESVGGMLSYSATVDYATNADELIDKVKLEKYSLILTDNNMEDGHGDSGLYVVEEIRKFNKEIPIVMISAGGKEIMESALKLGANEFIRKPLDFVELENKIKKYLKIKR